MTRSGAIPARSPSENSASNGQEASDDGRASDALEEALDHGDGEEITLGEWIDQTGGRAHGVVLLALSIPEAIPMIGLSAVLALPILGLGGAMLIRGGNPSIPRWVRDRTLPRKKVDSATRRALPILRWIERVSRPRWSRVAGATRFQGMICILMSVLLAIPVPGVNAVAAAAVGGVGLGILQRDGIAIVVSGVLAALALLGFIFAIGGVWSWLTGG